MQAPGNPLKGEDLVQTLQEYIEDTVARHGGATNPVKPGHRVKFHWPPHPVSYSYRVGTQDWTDRVVFEAYGEEFEVVVATTRHGVFGRCAEIWHEERGDTLEQMLDNLRRTSEPLFQRQCAMASALGRSGRFTGHVRDLPPIDLLKLLYCEDRDAANDARIEIETHASTGVFTPALIEILRDERHPYRRSAQWCVLDLFEDLPSFCDGNGLEVRAVQAMRDLIWNAPDDYARATFKAGVVLGGHIPHKHGTVLIDCLAAPSRIGRRSAIHGLFHVVEWIPERREEVVSALRGHAEREPEPSLREFAESIARDVEAGELEHVPEPLFEDER
jgi:hypothetical protein